MDNRIEKFYEKYMDSLTSEAHDFGLLYFDHLYSEYMAMRSTIDFESQELMDGLHQRRVDRDPPLTWNDIYLFDLELLKYLPLEDLVSKAYDMRARYRNVAGEKEYELYTASKPPDLSAAKSTPASPASPLEASPLEASQTEQTPPVNEAALRKDIRYLMKVFYLNYSLMKVREGVRETLMRKGVKWTLFALGLISVFVALNDFSSDDPTSRVYRYTRGLTVGVVLAAGCVGGLMSMLQRIQSAPSEGDALFNLASLTNGWRSIFLAPLTGAVFSVLLFVLFAGGVLKGTVFPDIYTPNAKSGLGSLPQIRQSKPESTPTPEAKPSATLTPSPESTSSATPPAVATVTPSGTATATPPPTPARGARTPVAAPTVAKQAEAKPTVIPTASPTASSTPSPEGSDSVAFSNFIKQTGPSSGVNYALLIIWSFIAGFAERLVPDTLSKLVTKSNL
ncbi:MAG: hypothetical protein QOH70_2886 [Blastocatellia bacterium]|jgi:hypothetical protein|nr:hypothetical protein [Blastocatellia bacterium]